MSVLNSILNSVRDRIDALHRLPKVIIRKRMMMLDGDKLPLLIVGLTEGETISTEAFGYIGYEYTIGVALIQAGNRNYTTGIPEDLDVRELLRNTLTGVRLIGVSEVWDTNIIEGIPLNIPTNGSSANYQISGIHIKYKTMEVRPNY